MHVLDASPGAALSAVATMYPCALEVVSGDTEREGAACTTYGYVLDGPARLLSDGWDVEMQEGCVFAIPGKLAVQTAGLVVLLTRIGFLGVPTLARLEERGRLAYIDGCSDTLLVSPPRFGDPVLNHLHFPPGTRQGMHRHPSVRLGVVARGKGMAVMAAGEVGLERGKVFLIEAHEAHAFRTEAENLDVVAFHPDSDWGPTDEVHPMRNRTRLIEG